jgi:hypothetical protein
MNFVYQPWPRAIAPSARRPQQFRPPLFDDPPYLGVGKGFAQGHGGGHGMNDVAHRAQSNDEQPRDETRGHWLLVPVAGGVKAGADDFAG